MANEKCPANDKFLLFWIGVLTGALLVGIIFLYSLYSEATGTNIFRVLKYNSPQVTNQIIKATTAPVSAGDPQPWAPVSAGDPQPWMPKN